ncbi:MAG: hypothetical protein LBI16_05485 [Burkholderiales bacterium]|jgi:hypothetical protein|nr:hypothetical protein [Burkholderiales bacterium]
MNVLSEIVKIFDVEPFVIKRGDGDCCHYQLRLEVVHNLETNNYKGKVYRLDFYRLQPTFPQSEGCPPDWRDDALIYVFDHMFDSDALNGESVGEVVEKFQRLFDAVFATSKQER